MARNIVVDGSNIATEGRTAPSLVQLREAVAALAKEYPSARITVVVDATFGHRIAKRDVAEFNRAVESNEMVSPPAGAVGRGDAFILAVAEKVGGAILSNDSFQEFHGKFKWLFEPGRLIGGKPVPHVGWVFVERTPVRGATSARATKIAKTAEKAADKSPTGTADTARPAARATSRSSTQGPRSGPANDLLPYLAFVEKNPIGTKTKAVVDSFAANGVSVRIGDINGYVPLRAIASPPPRSAREVFHIGDQATFVITGYSASRRSVDLGVPGVVQIPDVASGTAARRGTPAGKSPTKRTATKSSAKKSPSRKSVAKKTATTKTAAKKATSARSTPTKKAVAKKAAPRKPVKKAATRGSASVPARKSTASTRRTTK